MLLQQVDCALLCSRSHERRFASCKLTTSASTGGDQVGSNCMQLRCLWHPTTGEGLLLITCPFWARTSHCGPLLAGVMTERWADLAVVCPCILPSGSIF